MTTDSSKPPEREASYCGHCNLNVSMTLLDERRLRPGPPGRYTGFERGPLVTTEQQWVCSHCDQSSLRLVQHRTIPGKDGTRRKRAVQSVLYPKAKARGLDNSAPEAVRSAFAEAAVCRAAGAMRAAGVMYRAAVEEICKDRGATGPNLYSKIENLGTQGLDTEIVQDFHEARLLGNDSIHDLLAYATDEVDDIADLIEEAVYALYVQPAKKADYRQKRAARRQNPPAGT